MKQVAAPRDVEHDAGPCCRPSSRHSEGGVHLGLGPAERSLSALQRVVGNRSTVRLLAEAPIVQRLFEGYYVVCASTDSGALLIGNDKQRPKRYYRTVASISAKAKKAADQPFWVSTLYDDPEAASQLTVIPESGEEQQERLDEAEDQEEESVEEDVSAPVKKKKKKKKENSKKPDVPIASSAEEEAPEEPVLSAKEARKRKYFKTSALKTEGDKKQNFDYLESEMAKGHKQLEKVLVELGGAWLTELDDETGLERATLDGKQQEFRDAMPTWDGEGATKTVEAIFRVFPQTVSSAKDYLKLVKELGQLKAAIGAPALVDLLSVFTPTGVASYAKAVGGEGRLTTLMTTHAVPAVALKHYGAGWMKEFEGADPGLWTHLVTASLNSHGAISGGHDEAVFNAFTKEKKYQITNNPVPAPVYRVEYANAEGSVTGSKTLIRALKSNKDAWMARFTEAIWRAVARRALSDGSFRTTDGQGQSYDGFYTKGRPYVETIWPVV